MIVKTKHLVKKIGIDSAIFYSVLSRVFQGVSGLISIFFIAHYLTKVEQGYYYTFGSILAIQIFFELGLTGIITQFVAHEKAFLNWESETTLSGNLESLSRLSSLLRFCVKWFGIMSCILFLGLIIAGFIFFNSYGKQNQFVEWQIPWIVLSIITATSLMVSPIMAFFEGLGKVAEIAKIRLVQQLIQMSVMFPLLMLGMKLYSSPIAALCGVLVPPYLIFISTKKEIIKNLWKNVSQWKINYRREIFPYQWRIALSWMSGFFIFQLFNPVTFATEGAKIAGQMGMTLAVLNGILSIPLSWLNTKVPLFSSLIALKDYKNLDTIFRKTVLQSSMVCIFSLFVFLLGVYGLKFYNIPLGERFLSLPMLVLLSGCILVNQLVGAWATYLRCHKQEPFLILSIAMGVMTTFSTLSLGKFFGIEGIVAGYSFLTIIVSLLWAYFIFLEKRNEWHK